MLFFILGSHPELSIAEIAAVIGKKSDFSRANSTVLFLDEPELFPETLQNRLGGTSKIGRIIAEMTDWNLEEATGLIAAFFPQKSARFDFGLSVYDAGNPSLAGKLRGEQKKLGMELKKTLKETGKPVRYVSSKEPALSSVIVETNRLLDSGGEFALFATKDGVLIGQTETVQDFEAWSKRDYGRPERDPKSGMLPPKLARMMVNLAGVNPEGAALLDPFCGSGTVLMEAALLGFPRLIGCDILRKAVKDTRKNMAWLNEHFGTNQEPQLFEQAAETLENTIQDRVDAVVTETYLGPPRKGTETAARTEETMGQLTRMYADSFKAIYAVMKTGATAVIAFPAYAERGSEAVRTLPLRRALERLGFAIENALPDSLPAKMKYLSRQGGLLYHRKGQRVGREILILKK